MLHISLIVFGIFKIPKASRGRLILLRGSSHINNFDFSRTTYFRNFLSFGKFISLFFSFLELGSSRTQWSRGNLVCSKCLLERVSRCFRVKINNWQLCRMILWPDLMSPNVNGISSFKTNTPITHDQLIN